MRNLILLVMLCSLIGCGHSEIEKDIEDYNSIMASIQKERVIRAADEAIWHNMGGFPFCSEEGLRYASGRTVRLNEVPQFKEGEDRYYKCNSDGQLIKKEIGE